MARLASQSKGGYYPTPPEELDLLLKNFIKSSGPNCTVLDPCAGEGDALKQIGDYLTNLGSNVETYGTELEKSRAEIAKAKATKVLTTGYEWLRASNNAFSLLYLNPPYDYSSQNKERMETTFFRNLTLPDRYVQPGALVILCIPKGTLKDLANLLAIRLEKIQVVRFTDKNYSNFSQVFVLGYRRNGRPTEPTMDTRKWLENLAEMNPKSLPTVENTEGIVTYSVPVNQNAVSQFRGSVFDPEEIANDIDSSGLFEDVMELFLPMNTKNAELKNPLLPLKPTHYAVAIAAGAVGGNMGNHIIVGNTKKVTDTKKEADEDKGGEKITEIQRFVTKIRAFTPQGVYDLE